VPKLESFDDGVAGLLRERDVPGGAVAVVREGRLVYARGFGYGVVEEEEPAEPDSLFRIASISKPVTAVATMKLVEEGDLALDDRAFEILDHLRPADGVADSRVDDITIRMLLEHSGGWRHRRSLYPMFELAEIAREEGTEPPADAETVVAHVLRDELDFEPGTDWAYSNFGYCVLGRVIEAVTGTAYETHVREAVLGRTGVDRMRIAGTRERDRADGEVKYYGGGEQESVFPDEGTAPAPYGVTSLATNDANGGWLGSPVDLVRLLTHVDGRGPVDDVLAPESIETMTARPDLPPWEGADVYYGRGWLVRPDAGNWWHDGSLPGTFGILLRLGDRNLGVAALFNSRSGNLAQFNRAVQGTLFDAADAVSTWPDHDLFDEFD
jgi:N-acyl-D-amino-acid deacylase